MLMAASFKQEMENLVPVRIMCDCATSPDVKRKVSFPPMLGCGCTAGVTVSILRLLHPRAMWDQLLPVREMLPEPPRVPRMEQQIEDKLIAGKI